MVVGAMFHLAGCCIAVLSLIPAVSAQTFTGTITGRVVDSQQSAVTDASIVLGSIEKDLERCTSSNTNGEYAFELVPPGRFFVRAESSGLTATTVNVEVVVDTTVRADLVLRVQSVKEEVRVPGEGGVSAQAENASLGRVVSPHEMTELPSLGRSPYDFRALMAGATPSNDALGVAFAVNGGRTQSANYLLDGTENNETMSAPAKEQGHFYLPDYKDFAPRLEIAYDPFGDGKTVVRAALLGHGFLVNFGAPGYLCRALG